jgi:hypothetical protein
MDRRRYGLRRVALEYHSQRWRPTELAPVQRIFNIEALHTRLATVVTGAEIYFEPCPTSCLDKE